LQRLGLGIAIGGLAAALLLPGGVGAAAPGATAGGAQVKAIVTYKSKPGAAEKAAIKALGGKVRHAYTLIDGMAVTIPANAFDKLRKSSKVKTVEHDATITAMEPVVSQAATGDLEYDNAWGVTHIGSKAVHDAGIKGAGIKVAVIDTGIDYIHDVPPDVDPEFLNIYKGGYDFFNNDPDPMDDNGHGTHVAGILAAEKNGYLVVGVAPQVDLYALKVIGADGTGDVSNAILALQWAVGHGIQVVNMSFGTHEISSAFETAVANASAAGLLMVAAAGNATTITELFLGCAVAYPGAYPQVLSTTFTNPNDALTGESCVGPQVDFGAPGQNIFSPVPVGTCQLCSSLGYASLSGTSMASPHLAGTVALLLYAGIQDHGAPGLFDDVRAQLCATANPGYGVQSIFGQDVPITTSDPRYANWFGCGIVDAQQAVLSLAPPVNSPPLAVDETASTPKDTPTDIAVLDNDSDPDGDALSVTSATDPANGTTTVNLDNTVHYVPDAGYTGLDHFDYTISDGNGGTDTGSVTVAVTAVNTPPDAVADDLPVVEDTPTDLAVLANDTDADGDPLTIVSIGGQLHGTATANVDGTVHFVPDPNFFGDASFDYTISDGHGGTDLAPVKVRVSAVNDPPVAVNDTATTSEDVTVDVNVLANDSDVDGGAISVTGVSGAVKGTASINGNGTVHFVPTPNANGAGSFQYTISDGAGGTASASVSVTINAVNDPPVAVNDSATTAQGAPVTVSVLANDTDIDSGSLSIGSVSDPPHGTAVANANGTVTYTPDAGYSGPDAFGYTASDGSALSNVATVSITVTAAPPPNPFHIGDLDGSTNISGKQWTAKVTIRAHTAAEGNASGIIVTGTWSTGGSASCTTATNGTCTVQSSKLSRTSVASATFTVVSATRSGWTYVSASNHDPDNDGSNGTVITILRP
jgi:subtilisin family serine protease